MKKILKKHRGGQPGNQNGRRHGFYSKTLRPSEICELIRITNTEGLTRESAVFRIKLKSVQEYDPFNSRVLMEAVKVITNWTVSEHHLSKVEAVALKKHLRAAVKSANPVFVPLPGHETIYNSNQAQYCGLNPFSGRF